MQDHQLIQRISFSLHHCQIIINIPPNKMETVLLNLSEGQADTWLGLGLIWWPSIINAGTQMAAAVNAQQMKWLH